MRAMLLATGLSSLLAGCPDRTIAILPVDQVTVESKDIPVVVNRDLDILFVIDKSPTMADEQAALTANFGRFMQILSGVDGGLPNIHIGVISQDMGSGGFAIGGCSGRGDAGRLLNAPRVAGCSVPTDAYISNLADPDGGRVENYSGTLEETFSCIASLGDVGCGFEQHLGSLEAALFDQPLNSGFLRPNALLAVIIISDEDDCTAHDPQIYNPANAAAGTLADYRCFEYGWECDEGTMGRDPATYKNCRPRESSPYLKMPDALADRLKSLKVDPRNVIVSTIIGPSALTDSPNVPDTRVVRDTSSGSPVPRVEPSCKNGAQNAFPMPRLAYFAQQFEHNSFYSLCNDDLGGGLTQIANLIRRVQGNPCFEADLTPVDRDPANPGTQLECSVSLVDGAVESVLPTCRMLDANTPADTDEPCWFVRSNEDQCADYPTKLELVIWPEDRPVALDQRIRAQCTSD